MLRRKYNNKTGNNSLNNKCHDYLFFCNTLGFFYSCVSIALTSIPFSSSLVCKWGIWFVRNSKMLVCSYCCFSYCFSVDCFSDDYYFSDDNCFSDEDFSNYLSYCFSYYLSFCTTFYYFGYYFSKYYFYSFYFSYGLSIYYLSSTLSSNV